MHQSNYFHCFHAELPYKDISTKLENSSLSQYRWPGYHQGQNFFWRHKIPEKCQGEVQEMAFHCIWSFSDFNWECSTWIMILRIILYLCTFYCTFYSICYCIVRMNNTNLIIKLKWKSNKSQIYILIHFLEYQQTIMMEYCAYCCFSYYVKNKGSGALLVSVAVSCG